jgi:hypothetical protein
MTDSELLRHTLATLAYRGGKTMRGAPADFADYRAGGNGRSAGEILAHLADLLDWALSMCEDRQEWHDSHQIAWDDGAARFFAALEKLDRRLESPVAAPLDKLFQGPIADSLTHVGQLAMMRRMAGAPIKGENYYVAAITRGRVSADQPSPIKEF